MKRSLISILILLFAFSQGQTQSVNYLKDKGIYKFYSNDHRISVNDLEYILRDDKDAYLKFRNAKTGHKTSTIFIVLAAGYCAFEGFRTFGPSGFNFLRAGIAMGVVTLSVAMRRNSNVSMKEAVDIYNNKIEGVSYQQKPYHFQIQTSQDGLGLAMRF